MNSQDKQAETNLADPRWARILARDKAADGEFWYTVDTTGVYCRPSCPSRGCNPKNVTIHDTLESARATGFRACMRCKPDGPAAEVVNAEIVTKACRIIEASEAPPSLTDLAEALALSPGYFHRIFKAHTGLTPKGYAAAHRAKRVREALAGENSVTEAIYDAGFNSSGRFYEASNAMLGMTPSSFRKGGAQEAIRFAIGETTLGSILVASSTKGVAAILLGDDPEALVRDLQDRFPNARLIGADADYEAIVARIVGFVEAPQVGLDLPLDVRGTAFQQRVWQALRDKTGGASTDEELRRLAAGLGSWMRGSPFNAIEQVLGVPEARIGQCKRTRDLVLRVANRSLYLIAAAFSELARETLTRLGRTTGNPAALEVLAVAIRKGFDAPEKIAFAHRSPSLRTRTAVHRDYGRRFGAPDPILGRSYEAILQHVDAVIAFDAFDRDL